VNVHYIPVHTQPYYQEQFRFNPDDFPKSVAYYQTCLSLPIYFELNDDAQDYIIQSLKEVFA